MILFFGPAGSGKSTQAQMIVENNSYDWLSMGQLFRETTDPEVHELMQRGELVSFEKTNQVLGEALDKFKNSKKLILDGYPRDLKQAEWLIQRCAVQNISIDLALNFDVSIEELLRRMELRGRADDTPESIKKRLEIYHKGIDPILECLAGHGTEVIRVDGTGTIEDIHERVEEVLIKCKLA
jgi:adenylate kinase